MPVGKGVDVESEMVVATEVGSTVAADDAMFILIRTRNEIKLEGKYLLQDFPTHADIAADTSASDIVQSVTSSGTLPF